MHLRRDNQSDGSQDTHPSSTLHPYLVINIYLLISQRDAACLCAATAGTKAVLPWPLWLTAPYLVCSRWESGRGGPRTRSPRLWFVDVGSGTQPETFSALFSS